MTRLATLLLFVILALASLALGVMLGSVDLGMHEIAAALVQGPVDVSGQIVWQLRLPRVTSAFACGGLLALSGVLLQALLRNPMADPYILGISGGAAVGALSAILLGLSAALIHFAAWGGAMATTALILVLGLLSRAHGVLSLLLTGIALSAGFGGIISLILTLAPAAQLHSMLFWLMGDLSHSGNPQAAWLVLILVSTISMTLGAMLNVLGLGEREAQALGIKVRTLEASLILLAAIATATAVVEAGSIGFVGLVVPHLIRLSGVADHRWLLPMSVLVGGTLVSLADSLARTIAAPVQLPVGILTTLIGVPALIILLHRHRL